MIFFLSSEFALSGVQTVQHREKKEKKSHQRAVTLAKALKGENSQKTSLQNTSEAFKRTVHQNNG